MRKCPNCNAEINEEDNFCIYCGKDLRGEESTTSNVERECRYCHEKLGENEKFCPKCGMEVEPNANYSTTDAAKLSFLNNYKKFWTKAFDFKSKSNVKEFWDVFWMNILVNLGISVLELLIPFLTFTIDNATITSMLGVEEMSVGILSQIVFPLLILVPQLSLYVRRMKDIGKEWYSLLISFVPFIGSIILFIWTLRPSNYYKSR